MKKLSIAVCIVLFSFLVNAATEEVGVVLGLNRPPYIDKEKLAGYEVELFRQVLTAAGMQPFFIFVPNRRIKTLVSHGDFDVASHQSAIDPNGFMSCPYISYSNVVVTLAQRNLLVDSVADLYSLSVMAFHGAANALGSEFSAMAKRNIKYKEQVDQTAQVEMLMLGRVDAIVLDAQVFKSVFQQNLKQTPVDVHAIFPKVEMRALFKDKTLAEKFCNALARYIQTEDFEKLQLKYFNEITQGDIRTERCSEAASEPLVVARGNHPVN